MFGVLLESTGRRPRRTGSMAASAVIHMALVAAAATAGVRQVVARQTPRTLPIVYMQPVPPRRLLQSHDEATSAVSTKPWQTTLHIRAPEITLPSVGPVDVPVIQFGAKGIDNGWGPATGALRFALDVGGRGPGSADDAASWSGSEATTHVLTSATPRYPDFLRSAGVEGTVVVQFLVDTTGHVDLSTVRIIRSSHDLFARAVRDALPRFVFESARIHGARTPVLAQMPFEFVLNR